MVQKRPPGNRVRTREHLHARRRADEGRRVYERGDEPAGVWVCGRVARRRSALASNHCTGPFRPGRWLAGRGREGERARGRRRGCGSGRGRGGRWPRRAVRGASLTVGRLRGRRPGDGEGVRGNRGGSRGREGRPVGGGRWGIAGERAGGRTRWGRGERGGSVGERGRRWPGTRQLAVGHGCARTVVEAARQLAAALTSWQWTGGTAGRTLGIRALPGGGWSWSPRGRRGGEEGRPGCRGATAAGECTVSCW